MNDKISVLIAARKNSKYLAKFLFGCLERTADLDNMEILVMLNAHDTWNRDLVDFFKHHPFDNWIRFFEEDEGLGRAGLHAYFNTLLQFATGDWIVYFCEDHYIIKDAWDLHVRKMIMGELKVQTEVGEANKHEHGRLDPHKVWVLVPSFDNVGPMNHIVSRAYIEAQGGVLARHGNLDSYINDVTGRLRDRTLRFDSDEPLFHDFTHDQPSPMSDATMQSVISEAGKLLPKYGAPIINQWIDQDVTKLREHIEGEK